ncbi:MAG: shikimate dehydrogenase [Desulfobacterales bacterium]|jgi:shikimate dehydrogenase|nr:shikimate dehydrogenase [Desulfobacterales bacterium]
MKVFCILSDERAFQSKSPLVFTRVMQRLGIKGTYVPFKVAPEHLGQAVHSIRILNMAGANITVPYKEAVMPFIDVFSEGANMIGAVNTIVRHGNDLKGYNTNAIGFMDALKEACFDVSGKTALVFGNGGMAKAVVFILNWLQADTIYIAGRNHKKTLGVIQKIGGQAVSIDTVADRPLDADIVINTTSVSMTEEAPELAAIVNRLDIQHCRLVADMNYGRSHSFWEQMALSRQIPFMDGLSTLVHQARRTFLLWTGIQVPPEEFQKALEE